MDPELIKLFASAGLGGIVAVVVLYWKRTDDQRYMKSLEDIIARLEARDVRAQQRDERLLQIVEANTNALRGLQTAVENVASIRGIEERLRTMEEYRGRS